MDTPEKVLDNKSLDFLKDISNITANNILRELDLSVIKNAAGIVDSGINKTPSVLCDWLSDKIKGSVHLKLENTQVSGSVKTRGVCLKLLSLSEEQKQKGVIAMSIGNHALSVAKKSSDMGIKSIIVMPENTCLKKVSEIKAHGASVILQGKTMLESRDFAMQLVKKHGYTMIHPFDDPLIIAGQGTVGLEIMNQIPNVDTLLVPIGGGALAAGVCIAAKAINPNIYIIGVQSEFCPATAEILFPNSLPDVRQTKNTLLSDYLRVQFPGELALEVLSSHLDDCLVVPEKKIAEAITSLITKSKVLAEGAGALSVAAILHKPEAFIGKKVCALISGGNLDQKELTSLLMNNEKESTRMVCYHIKASNNCSVLGQLTQVISKAEAQLFELSQQEKVSKNQSFKAVVETRDMQHSYDVFKALVSNGFEAVLIED